MKSGLPVGVDVLLDPARTEGLRVEYKADWNHLCGGSALKTICAFANDLMAVNGGYVVFGVEEKDGTPVRPVRGIEPQRLDRVQKELHGALMKVEPRYVPMVTAEPVDGTYVLVAWCPAGDARPYTAPESLDPKAPRHPWVRTTNLTQEAKGELLRRLHEAAPRIPFDDRGALDASLDDLSPSLLHAHLVQSRSRLASERLEVAPLCRRLNLSRKPNGHEVPRNVALLFFADEPTRWFPSARIEVTTFPEGRNGPILRQMFEGPLPGQVRGALDYLKGQVVERIDKLPDRPEAAVAVAWPFPAVEEAVVNAVHHRGYDSSDSIKIEVLPDELRITSYPGPVEGVTREALLTGDFPAVPSRNRRIAELLRDVKLAEAARTGVVHIRESMRANGSPAPQFGFDEARTYFEVRLPIHPALAPKPASVGQPIRVGRPAPPIEVVGREDLVAKAWRVLPGQSIALYGPRGRGVSTVLGAIAAAPPADTAVMMIDAAGVNHHGLEAALETWLEGRNAPPGASIGARLEALPEERVVLVLDNFLEHNGDYEELEGMAHAALGLAASARLRLVVGLGAPSDVPDDLRADWDRTFWMAAVPPLSAACAHVLAERLLTGAGVAEPTRVNELAELSWGIPSVLHYVAHHLSVEPERTPAEILDDLLVNRGDPTGLATRIQRFRELQGRHGYSSGYTVAERAVLAAVAGVPTGKAHLDVVALATRSAGRLDVLRALRDLELSGWIVRVDDRLRMEHPYVAAEWRPEDPSANAPQDDVPF